MGVWGLKQAVFAVGLVVLSVGSAAALPRLSGEPGAGESGILISAHFRKVYSFYCYPKNYWWFYRPYTTASQNYARCMPYFHYLDEAYPRGSKPYRALK
jgi:hypothetical protein